MDLGHPCGSKPYSFLHAGTCLSGIASLAAIIPGRALAEASGTATLGGALHGTGSGGTPAEAGMPLLQRVAAAEGAAGRHLVTAAFLRLLVTLLARRCIDAQLHVREQ